MVRHASLNTNFCNGIIKSKQKVYLKNDTNNKSCFDLEKMFPEPQPTGIGAKFNSKYETLLTNPLASDIISVLFTSETYIQTIAWNGMAANTVSSNYDKPVYIEINQEDVDYKFQCP